MDYIVIIAIVVAILASTFNDAQKRRRRAQNTPQEPDIPPMHGETSLPKPQPHQQPLRPKVQRPRQEMPEEVRAAIEYAQQRTAKSRKALRQQPQPTKPVTVAKEPEKVQPAPTTEKKQQGSTEPFDIERAIVYSEILQPKYKEYE